MKILVTGGAGFIGPHVVAELAQAGHHVAIFDQRVPTYDCPFVQGNLTSLPDLLHATAGVDSICHLGGVGDVYLAFEQPYVAAAANAVGTANVMEAAKCNKLKKVVYASTWEVYGKQEYQPIDEKHPCRPDHPYSITKLAGEQLALAYDHLKGVPTIALRLGTAYGLRMRPNSVFSLFIQRASKGEPVIIQGTGAQTRQFTHARDIARAFRLAVESPLRAEVFNIVASENISIRQLAEMVVARFPTEIAFKEARTGDVPPSYDSSEKVERMLGWQPQVTFVRGLDELMTSHVSASVAV